VDWAGVEPVDILAAGFPCQPVSAAGKRKGIEDERWLFDDICEAIGRMGPRPRLLVFENVAGLLSANGGDAMARVIHGLAAIGYVGRYRLLRASDVGAPHKRERWFCIARPAADTEGARAAAAQQRRRLCGLESPVQDPDSAASGERRKPAPGQAPGGRTRPDAGGPGGAPAPDTSSKRRERQRQPEAARTPDWRRELGSGEPAGSSTCAPADTTIAELRGPQLTDLGTAASRAAEPGERASALAWGAYEPAIRRWETVTGRPAPRPTEPGRTGERLSPRFVEWMQGLPEGWVTGVPGLSRNQQLHALGNGVVPQQAAMALRLLLGAIPERSAA
jgi:DNA (cytosine-5)-methyltransferase 1